jgi:hypothetical protein
MKVVAVLTSLFFISSLLADATFTPPKDWKKADDSALAKSVKEAFFTKSKKEIPPSINLALEKVSLTAHEYLKAVQKTHESDPKNRWRKLGSIKTSSGTAYLTSLDTETPAGTVRILQSILLDSGTAYILTGAALQEEFPLYQKEFLDSFQSLVVFEKN